MISESSRLVMSPNLKYYNMGKLSIFLTDLGSILAYKSTPDRALNIQLIT